MWTCSPCPPTSSAAPREWALYVKKPLRLPALIQGGGQEKGRRSGTENVPGAVGMAAALREAVDGLSRESPAWPPCGTGSSTA